MSRVVVVIPCYNEATRLRGDLLLAEAGPLDVEILLVDDGSKDDTRTVIEGLAGRGGGRIRALALPENRGKAEAVREGMRRALADGADVTGYLDADLSTSLPELRRIVDVMLARGARAALGSRVAMLGSDIRRSPLRHYLGRIFATVASLALELRVYDTQCGAKVFARTPALEAALAEPFISRWAFDVELIGRLLTGSPDAPGLRLDDLVEVPLQAWADVPGSKLNPWSSAKTLAELGVIARDLRRRRLRAS